MQGSALIELQDLGKTFTVYERAGRVRRRKREVRAVDGIDLVGRGRVDGRLHRPERRREVDDHQDADRHPRAECAARCGSTASIRHETASRSPAASAWCSASAPSCGGTCRSPTRSSCSATCTACPRPTTGRRSAGWSSCSTWARSSPPRCASSRSGSGCGASSPRPCSTVRRCSSSTSRRSASTSCRRRRSAPSSATCTASRGRRCC